MNSQHVHTNSNDKRYLKVDFTEKLVLDVGR